ncbi:MAG TPA: hypothetical protein VKU00_28940 [Chthonomonadaceae bacterium]|nr:hypothetical protein [Chthonomonadaceae bacterium]
MVRTNTRIGLVCLVSVLAALAATCGFVTPAQAQIPLSGSGSGDGTITPLSGGLLHLSFNLDGTDNLFGSFVGEAGFTVDLSNPANVLIENGTFQDTFAGGTLFGTVTGSGHVVSPGVVDLMDHDVITGGTGIFAGATGDIFTTASVDRTSPTTFTGNVDYTGDLVLTPEPCSLGLLAGGLLVPGAMLLFRRFGLQSPRRP